jgi:hypothetical protein
MAVSCIFSDHVHFQVVLLSTGWKWHNKNMFTYMDQWKPLWNALKSLSSCIVIFRINEYKISLYKNCSSSNINSCHTHIWVWIPLSRGVLNTTLCDKVCQWLVAGWWFCPGTPVSSTNKTDHHGITEILFHTESSSWQIIPF